MKLTKNFTRSEFDCKDGTKVPKEYHKNLKKLATNLQALRDFMGAPVYVSGSGYRTPKHNKAVGGAPKSQHLTASAADINVKGFKPLEVYRTIERLINDGVMEQGGLGLYDTFIHYDIRGKKARWDLRKRK